MKYNCSKTGHLFSAPGKVGGGLLRSTCTMCSLVTIDLSQEPPLLHPVELRSDRHNRTHGKKDLLVLGVASA